MEGGEGRRGGVGSVGVGGGEEGEGVTSSFHRPKSHPVFVARSISNSNLSVIRNGIQHLFGLDRCGGA